MYFKINEYVYYGTVYIFKGSRERVLWREYGCVYDWVYVSNYGFYDWSGV